MVGWLEGQVPFFAFLAAVLATGFCLFLLVRSPRNSITLLVFGLTACLAEWNLFAWLGSVGAMPDPPLENLECVGYSLAPAVLLHFAATVVGLGRMQSWALRAAYATSAVFGFLALGGLFSAPLQAYFRSEQFNDAWVAIEGPVLALGIGVLGVGAASGPRESRGILRFVLAAGIVAGIPGILDMLRGAGGPGMRAANLGAAIACVLLAVAARRFPEVFDSLSILRREANRLLSRTRHGLVSCDATGEVVHVNDIAARILGGSPRTLAEVDSALPGLLGTSREHVFRRGDRVVRATLVAARAGLGGELRSHVLLEDCTEEAGLVLSLRRQRAETEKAREDYQRLLESMPAVFYSSRLGGEPPERVDLYVSPRLADALGYEPSAWIAHGRLWREKVPPEDQARVLESIRAAAKGGGDYSVEYRIAAKDGRVRWVRDTGTATAAEDGSGLLLEGFGADITEQKVLEAEFHQAQKMEALGQLAAGVAHDFNNLLTVIEGYTELLATRFPDGDPARPWAREVQEAGRRAAALTRQLLAFSRKQPAHPVVLSPNDSVGGIEKMLRRLLPPSVDLRLDLDPGAGRVRADPGQIDQVLMNLTVNARDAMPSGGTLTIATGTEVIGGGEALPAPDSRPGRYARITVSDTGTGMDAATMARIFEPFFTTKGPGKGTGLGLATVYGIVRQSGGFLRLSSEPGKGATFRVYLPATEDAAADAGGTAGPAPAPRGAGRILVAEDEPAILALVRNTLTAHGYEVLEARDGEQALAVAEAQGVGLLAAVLDIALPKVEGTRVALRLRERRPGIRCLFVTGSAEFVGFDPSSVGSGTAVLEKPFTGPALVQALGALLAGPRASG